MDGFQWMLDKSAGIDFTLIDFHVTIGRNQRPRVGNVTSRHVCMANVLTNNSVYLKHNNALISLPAATETADALQFNHYSLLHFNSDLPGEPGFASPPRFFPG